MTDNPSASLLKTRRFLPLFLTQALAAFNDNALRYAITILMVYQLAEQTGQNAGSFVAIGTALFIAPYFLFSATAGELADRYDKAMLARRIKGFEFGIMVLGGISLWQESPVIFLAVLFLAGTQAAFFSPVKFGLLPQHLGRHELVAGNGLIEMSTFMALLLGTLYGGGLVLGEGGRLAVAGTVIALGLIGWWLSARIPPAPAPAHEGPARWNPLTESVRILAYAGQRPHVFRAILGISWFWFTGALMMALFPPFTKDVLGADVPVANLMIAVFTLGIGTGSLLVNRLLAGAVSARFVPLAGMLMALFIGDLWFAIPAARPESAAPLRGLAEFVAAPASWRVLADLFLISFAGGLYVVPLNAIMQARSVPRRRARVIAANNILNALFMTVSSALAAAGFAAGLDSRDLFGILALLNGAAAIAAMILLPRETITALARFLFRLAYRVEVRGIENFHAAGPRAVIVANHLSFIDGPLLSVFLPGDAAFAVNAAIADKSWMHPVRAIFDIAPLEPGNPMALRGLVAALRRGRRVVIFPEGRITVTGSLMKIYDGPAAIAEMGRAKILPVRIDGAQYTVFSRLRGKLRLRLFPKITITILPPEHLSAPDGLRGNGLREHLGERLYTIMTGMIFASSPIGTHLVDALLEARKLHGGRHFAVEDMDRRPLSYRRLIAGSFILGQTLAKETGGQRNVAVLLPNAMGCVVTLFGLLMHGRVPAMLNYATGAVNMAAALRAAEASTIITSRRFIAGAGLEDTAALLGQSARIIYLEDIRAAIGARARITGLLKAMMPRFALRLAGMNHDPDAPAVILFTSGSEGLPKGVVLSHRNINANRHQAAARIAFTAQDIVVNPLPMFHAFGLTVGTLLPMLAGVRTVLYPSPLHYKMIPELCYDVNATILFATDTFLMGYGQNAHPYDFYSLRYVVSGAERARRETRELWMDKFGLRILEGYGATECAPVLSVNTPLQFRPGSGGKLLDGIEARIEPVEGITEGGRLVVRGPNVMLGYLRADNPGVLEPPQDGWYDTGDIVKIDGDNFLWILGRARRFSKIAGEMVSLTAVENAVIHALPGYSHAVVAIPDQRKGEQLVLITTCSGLDRRSLAEALRPLGIAELLVPRHVITVAELPLLGTGKTDYVTLNRLARERAGS